MEAIVPTAARGKVNRQYRMTEEKPPPLQASEQDDFTWRLCDAASAKRSRKGGC